MLRAAAVLVIACMSPAAAGAQSQECAYRVLPLNLVDAERQQLRAAEITGATGAQPIATVRLSSIFANRGACIADTMNTVAPRARWRDGLLAPAPVRLSAKYNSAYPRDRNNGAEWAGKGVTLTATGGVVGRAASFSYGLLPLATYTTNDAVAARALYSGIDKPERMGEGAFRYIDLGGSFVRVDVRGLGIGVSNENVWWGPQRHFPLLMSNTAAGFPHLFAGTNRLVDIGIGKVEGELIWGRLNESDFFDGDPDNDRWLFAGLTAGFAPRWLPGLRIGAARAYHRQAVGNPDESIWDLLRVPYQDVRLNPAYDNQLLSVFARWVFPASGFEVFGEWARDDHWGDAADLLKEIDSSLAYALGFQKVLHADGYTVRIAGEHVDLETAIPHFRGGRNYILFYTNQSVPKGHTNRGQLLGAWPGTGSSAQMLTVERVEDGRMVGVALQRTRFNTDLYYLQAAAGTLGTAGHDREFAVASHYQRQDGARVWSAELGLARRYNRQLLASQRQLTDAEWNLSAVVTFTWRP